MNYGIIEWIFLEFKRRLPRSSLSCCATAKGNLPPLHGLWEMGLRLLDEAVVHPHVIREEKYSARGELRPFSTIVQFPRIRIPMGKMAILNWQYLTFAPVASMSFPRVIEIYRLLDPKRD